MRYPYLFAAALVAASCSSLGAQTVTGAVRGTVTDPSGAIVPNAKVTATNTATGVQSTTTTDSAGDYSIRFLQIGQYRLDVLAPGFTSANYGPFSLEIDQTAKIDIPLAVGSEATNVKVTSTLQPILQTESATVGETFTTNTINAVPLNGRDFSQLTVFTPGAVSTNYGQFGGQNSGERDTNANTIPNVNGNRQQSNNYLLDGQEINENINNTIGYNPSPDALDEIRVISSNANAEFGNVNGGDVLMVTKSGTNRLHGSAFAFLENYNLDANSWTNDNRAIPIQPFTQTIFGGTIGGPILKDKLFFFADYEGYRWHTGGSASYSVAPAAFRTGDLSALLNTSNPIQLYNTQNPGGPVPYVNNQVPITNPVAQYLFAHPNIYPLPNRNSPDGDPTNIEDNYIGSTASYQRNDQGDVKIDWHLHNDVISGRYSQGTGQNGTTQEPIPVDFPSASTYPDHLFTVDWTRSLSPSIVNLARASYARIRYNSGVTTDPSGVFGLNGNSIVGIPSRAQQAAGFSTQSYSTDGGTSPGVEQITAVGANPLPEIFIDNVYEYADNLTWQRGRNLFKFGAQFTRYQQNSFYPGNDGELGSFTYTGQFSAQPAASTTYGYADFLTDRVYEDSVGNVTGRTGQRQWRDAGFAQDDLKISTKLTLNLGLRYEFDQPIYEVNNKEANLNLVTGQIVYAGTPQANATYGSGRALYDYTYTNFMPRFGFAYQATDRFVLRGGYGITDYLEGTGANLRLTQNPPFHTDFDQIGTVPSGAGATYNGGKYYTTTAGFPTTSTEAVTTFYAWKKDLQPASIQEFSLFTEYQVARNSSLSVGYVGELGHHLTDPVYANQLTAPGATAPYANVVGQGGVVKVTASDSASNYNALEAVFRQRLTAGLEFTANYTYSKSLSNDIGYYGVSNIDGTFYQQNTYDLADEYGPSGSDVRHAINATGTYTIPYGRGQHFGSSAPYVLQSVAGGWRLSVSDVSYTGFPVTLTSPANYSNRVFAYTGAARPDQIRPYSHAGRSIDTYFGTAAKGSYVAQPDNAFGTVRPGSERAPGFENVDMALQKSFDTFREQRVDFRADFFNTFNIASYGNPDNGIADTNFGQINSTRSTERHIQFELKYAF